MTNLKKWTLAAILISFCAAMLLPALLTPISKASEVDTPKWIVEGTSAIYGPAIANNGTIYVSRGISYDALRAINPNGTVEWTLKLKLYFGSSIYYTHVGSPAVAEDGTIYVSAEHGFSSRLYAINPDGLPKWWVGIYDATRLPPTIGDDGTIYATAADVQHNTGGVFAVSPDGVLKWAFYTGFVEHPPVLGQDGTLYLGDRQGNLYAISPDGSQKWLLTGNLQRVAPVIGDDGIIYAVRGSVVQAINPCGAIIWSYDLGILGDPKGHPVIGEDGTIYAIIGVHMEGTLFAIEPNGNLKWSYPLGCIDASSPVIGQDGTIFTGYYTGTYEYTLCSIGPDGILQSSSTWPASGIATRSFPVIVEDGTLYQIISSNLYAIDVNTGLADSAWPMAGCDPQRSSRARWSPTTERASRENTLISDIVAEKAVMESAIISGDLSGILEFTEFELVTIGNGSFAGKGFSRGSWQASIEGTDYSGCWKGVAISTPEDGKMHLKGSTCGEVMGIIDGYLSESIPGSGVYDRYEAIWEIGRFTHSFSSATVSVKGTLAYESHSEFPETELRVLQTNIDGTVLGDYTGPLSMVITHVGMENETDPYYNHGFSIISYNSDHGSGDGLTYDEMLSPGLVRMNGLFSGPLYGTVSATLDERELPRTMSILVCRIDLGLPPMADLSVEVWGPRRVSPGQGMNYCIEYRNDGVKAADEVLVFDILDSQVEYVSASTGVSYSEFYHESSWNLGQIPPQTSGYLTVQVEVEWGLPQDTILKNSVYIVDVATHGAEILAQNNGAVSCEKDISLNGIDTTPGSPGWKKWGEFSDELNAEWYPIYGLGVGQDIVDVAYATPLPIDYDYLNQLVQNGEYDSYEEAFNAEYHGYIDIKGNAIGPNPNNGLTNTDITNHYYCTTYAYSGGTRTAITALRLFNMTCNRLVLISPIRGPISMDSYEEELEDILREGRVKEIIIYQSEEDLLPLGDFYQAKFYPETADWFNEEIDTPDGTRQIKDLIIVNPPTLDINGKTIKTTREVDGREQTIDQQNHPGIFKFINDQLIGEEGTSSTTSTTVWASRDPNIKYGPEGNVSLDQILDYRIEYENEGKGIAFGVYFTDTLDTDLDDSTLGIGPVISTLDGSVIAPAGAYDPATRTITWVVGEVGPGEGGYSEFSVNVRSNAPDSTEIINFATVYFPSALETTKTNAIVSIVRLNQPPAANANGPYESNEGAPITFNASACTDADGTIVLYEWDFDDNGVFDSSSTSPITTFTYGDDYIGNTALRVTDDDGLTSIDEALVTVNNIAPTVSSITAPMDPVPIDTVINTSGNFTDPGILDTHTAEWDWGDNSTSPGTVDEMNGSGNVTGSHSYTVPGVYTVSLNVTDDDGGWDTSVYEYVVVYDPSAGFVTGGGWINSPEGAYMPDPALIGKATFGFVSRYKKGATTPTGETEFQFKVADLNFHSTSYQWLVIAGANAKYKGWGSINGEGDYGFMLTATDEKLTPSTDVDMFRIKIWDINTGVIIYDNKMGESDDSYACQEIGGGSIVIHKK